MATKIQINRISVSELKRTLSVVVTKNARDFKTATRRRMEESIPTGKVYERSRGRSFTTRHRASAKGQRPAKLTGTLINAVNSTNTGEFSAVVDIRHIRSPEGGYADEYAETLVENSRQIMNSDDVRAAQIKLDFECQQAVNRLIK